MKLTMNAGDLAEMVSICALAIESRPIRPEFECLYLGAVSDRGIPKLTIVGQDSGNLIRKSTDRVTVEEDGRALIPAKTLLSFLKLMDGDVTLKTGEGNTVWLKCKGKRVTINCMDAEGYEGSSIMMNDCNEVRMNGADFGTLVNSVAHCVSVDTGRIALTGIYFSFDGMEGTVEACGMDQFKMAIATKSVETNDTFSALIPASSARLIQKVIGNAEDVSFQFGKGVVIAEAYDTMIQSSLLNDSFMDYKHLAQRNHSLRIRLKTADILNAVKIARVSSAEGKKDLIILRVKDEDNIEISGMGALSGAEITVPCLTEGMFTKSDGTTDGNEIAFSGFFMENALKAQEAYGEEAVLEFMSKVSPIVILPVERNDYFQLVLPVRLH